MTYPSQTQQKQGLGQQPAEPARRPYDAVKRAQDILLSALALVLLSPALLAVAAAVWLDDPHGSPIFSQQRVGQGGKPFKMYKFRSMIVNAEARLPELQHQNEMDGPVFKIRNDPRITRVGRFIRKTSIDELPQLYNVLRGEMSLVGPRPALPREVVQYTPREQGRLAVKPGLTCYWQVQPRRNELSFEQWVELDLQYIRDRSWLLDWQLLFKTVAVVFTGQGE